MFKIDRFEGYVGHGVYLNDLAVFCCKEKILRKLLRLTITMLFFKL